MKMNMTQYAGDMYLNLEDVRGSGPKQLKIEAVEEGSFDKPVLRFNDDTLLSLNATNTKTLIRSYGPESDDWIAKTVELRLGETVFQGKPKDSVLIFPVSPSIPISERTAPKPSAPKSASDRDREISDDIPL
jgi:hypothetical protein